MAGRRRRASTSSVETVDESDILWRQETSVLRSVPKDKPSDDWPIFELSDAIVLNKDGQTIENGLLSSLRGPFTVRGYLVIDDRSQKIHLIMRVRNSTPLVVRNSSSYAIGESADGRPLIWMSGQGGWYEINPSPAYKPMYNKMCEATTMYYKIQDIYKERSMKKSKKTKPQDIMDELGQVFHKYAARVGDGSTFEEVIARAHEHAPFFLDKFTSDVNEIDWDTTAFARWLRSEHPDLERHIKEHLEKAQQQPYLSAEEDSSRANARTRSLKGVGANDAGLSDSHPPPQRRKRKPGPKPRLREASEPKVSRPALSSTPTEEDGFESEASQLPAGKLQVTDPGNMAGQPREATLVPHHIWSERDKDPGSPFYTALAAFETVATDIAGSEGKKLITITGMLSKLHTKYSFPSFPHPYNQSAQECLHYYSKAFLHVLDSSYHAHPIHAELQRLAATDLIPLAYKKTDFPMAVAVRKAMSRKASGLTRYPSSPARQDDALPANTPRPKGKRPTRTPANNSSLQPVDRLNKKRPRGEFESDDPDSLSPSGGTRSRFFEDHDEMDLEGVSPTVTDEESDEPGKASLEIEPIRLVIRADKMPDTTPLGPDNTWTCDQDGCDHVVRAADEDAMEDRIRQHFDHHEQQLTRVNLALVESKRGHMPINHLLEKIKQISAAQDAQPIKRKLIV